MRKIFWIVLSAAVLSACGDDDAQDAPQPKAVIEIEAETLEFLPTGEIADGVNTVKVTSSGPWRLTGRKTWCTPSAIEGEDGDVVTFTAQPNTGAEPRNEIFTFICGGSTVRLSVGQGNDNIVECSQDRFDMDNTGGVIRLRMESNIDVTAEIDPAGAAWITPYTTQSKTRAMQTSWRYYRVLANDTYYPREGSIVLSGGGMEPKSLPVHQAQTDMLRIEGDAEYKGELEAARMKLTVWCNIPFEVVIPEDARGWVTLDKEPEIPETWSSQELTFDIAAAEDFRMAIVELKTARAELNRTVLIQQGEVKLLQFPDDNFREYLLSQKYIMASGDGYLMTAEGLALTSLDVYTPLWSKGGIASAEGVENFTNLTVFNCAYGRLRALDISATKIADVTGCAPNALETFIVGPGVTTVNFGAASAWSDGKLYDYTTRNTSTYPYTYYWAQTLTLTGENIETVNLWRNKLKTLDVSGCPKLKTLDCRMQETTLTTLYMAESQRGQVTVTKDGNTQIVYK